MKLIKILFSFVFLLLGIEFGARLFFVPNVGWQSLLFGTRYYKQFEYYYSPGELKVVESSFRKGKEVLFPEVRHGGYYTYSPNTVRKDRDLNDKSLIVNINSEGFRGKEFIKKKNPGTFRVLALGASSTFGFGSRESKTYPVQLEKILNETCRGAPKVEVLNLGISNLMIQQVRRLFEGHGLGYYPDMVIFWGGRNDSYFASYNYELTTLNAVARGLLLLQKIFNDLLITARMFDGYSVNFSTRAKPSVLSKWAKRVSDSYISEIEIMSRIARERGVKFVVANQQLRANLADKTKTNKTYRQHLDSIRNMVQDREILTRREMQFYFHGKIMEDLYQWSSKAPDVEFVDMISEFDQHRNLVFSEVHLSEAGNLRLAELMNSSVSDLICNH